MGGKWEDERAVRGCEEERGGVVRGGDGATVTKLRSLESAKVRYQSASFRPSFYFIFYISLYVRNKASRMMDMK